MKKFLCCMLAIITCVFTLFTGCDLITNNNSKALSTVVATAGDIKITREELINGYYNFGYQYVSSYGYSYDLAFEKTLELLIERELIVEFSKEKFGDLSLTETNAIKQEIYDNINNQLKAIEDEFLENEDEADEENESDWPVYSAYTKNLAFEDGKYIKIIEPKTVDTQDIGDFVQKVYTTQANADKAMAKYISNLKINSRDKKENITDADTLFQNEYNKLYKSYEKNTYIEKLSEEFNKNEEINSNTVLAKYKELVRESQAKYAGSKKDYDSAMQSDNSTVYYHPFGDQYIYVAHILVKFNDEDSAKNYQTQRESGEINEIEYNELMNTLANSITAKTRDENGNETDTTKTIDEIYNDVLLRVNSKSTLQEKAEEFNKLIYEYNQDDGMFNSEKYYVVNLDTTVTDTMVASFANESRDLYNNHSVGALSGKVVSEYGVHIIFYAGTNSDYDVLSQNPSSYANLDNITLSALDNVRIMQGTNKTMLDKIYDLVVKNEYDAYQSSLLIDLKKQLEDDNTPITYFKSRYSDIYK